MVLGIADFPQEFNFVSASDVASIDALDDSINPVPHFRASHTAESFKLGGNLLAVLGIYHRPATQPVSGKVALLMVQYCQYAGVPAALVDCVERLGVY